MRPSDHSIHLWFAPLDACPADIDRMWEILSADERQRAARIIAARDRARFVVARGLLRTLLSRCRGAASLPLEFCYGPHGKPSLPDAINPQQLQFSLAHSDGKLLLGVTRGRRIGVDLERMDGTIDHQKLAERFFSPSEYAALAALTSSERSTAWFRAWTVKEAYLKAIGVGLTQPLNTIEIFLPSAPRLLRIAGDAAEASRWQTLSLDRFPGFAAAVVVEGDLPEVHYHEWEW